jgi:prepilin-type N-terminal cleavage/methylation domain-containing protein
MVKMKRFFDNISGFSLIEMIVVIVVLGILASIAMQSMTVSVEDMRRAETEREMKMLAAAIVGESELTQAGTRADFGYVGDIGAFPLNLQALYQNPGGYTTWDGPYIAQEFTQDADGFKTDAWGQTYSYTGGMTITSTGSGSNITKKIANASGDYLLNSMTGNIKDASDSVPGTVYMDSVDITITIPNGAGGTTTTIYAPDSSGTFALDFLPVGTHALRIMFTPADDTLLRYVTILPRHKSSGDYRFASNHFTSSPPSVTIDSVTLRPDGDGSLTNLTPSGCGSNYLCVDEMISDGSSTRVSRAANSFATDVYSIENPTDTSGTIIGVTVYCRANKSRNQGQAQPTVFVGSTEYNGPAQDVINSWADYSNEWASNPATGTDWSWQEVIDLQAGLALKGQNASFPAYCTQVWVVVVYSN